MWNIKATVLQIVIGALGTVTKGLVKGLGGQGHTETSRDHSNYFMIEIGQNIEEESWRLEEACCHSNSSKRTSANIDVKNAHGVNNKKLITTLDQMTRPSDNPQEQWTCRIMDFPAPAYHVVSLNES